MFRASPGLSFIIVWTDHDMTVTCKTDDPTIVRGVRVGRYLAIQRLCENKVTGCFNALIILGHWTTVWYHRRRRKSKTWFQAG